jgi:hypothetical protein
MYVKDRSLARTLLIAGSLAGIVLAAIPSRAQNDPPPGSARLAHLQGNVSIQPDGVDGWGQAYPNQPAGSGDRLYTDQQSRGELQAAQVRTYFGPNSDLTLVNLRNQGVELGVAQGSSSIFSDGFPPGQALSVQTPNGAITVAGSAGFRVDVYADQQSTVVTNYRGRDPLTLNGGGGFYLTLNPGQSVQLAGSNPVYAQPLQPAPSDEFERWSNTLEYHRLNSISARYVSAEMPGYDELDSNGDWQPESDYGPIWFPRVEAGWAPYHYGHWVNMPFYGWTWVADEPWGAAPFHYGRWVVVGGRWGWIPGPREGHPVWSPAQVVFAGGVHVGGAGVSVWFPLGPGEAYHPWYPCSPQYVNRINITNIQESRVVHVQTTYINVVNVTNVTYVNRTVGVTAMRQEDFAAGHSTRTVAVKVDPHQLDHVQAARPEAPVPAQRLILHPVAKPAAVQQQRPVLINSKGQQAAAAPNSKPVAVPVKAAPPAPRPIPGHAPIGTPSLGGKPVAVPAKTPIEPNKPGPGNKPEPVSKQAPAAPVAPAVKTPPQPAKTVPAPAAKPQPVVPATKPVNPATPTARTPPAPAKTVPPPPVKAQPVLPAAKTPPQPTKAVSPPAAKPMPVTPAAKPARPAGEKPKPASKDDKKKEDKKKEEKKPE